MNKTGEIVFTNKAYRDFTNANGGAVSAVSERANYLATCDAALGKDAEYARAFARGLREVIDGTRPSFEQEYPCHAPDEQRWFLARVTRLPADDLGLVVIAHENITERWETKRQLQRVSDDLLRTSQMARVGGWSLDLRTNLLEWSDVTREIHEVGPDFVPDAQNAGAFFREGESRQRITEAFAQCIASGQSFELDIPIETARGRECWVRTTGAAEFEEGHCIRIHGTIQDIDERRRADDLLRLQMQRADALLKLPRLADDFDEATFMRRGMEFAEELTGSTTSFLHFVNEEKSLRTPALPDAPEPLERSIALPVVEKGLTVMLAGVGNKPTDYTEFDRESVQLIATAIWQIVRNARSTRDARDAATRLERLSEHLPGALYQFQIRPDGTACLPYASMGILDVYGVLPDHVLGDASGAFAAMHPDDRAEVDASIQESARTLSVWRTQHRVILPDGRVIWVEGEATPEAQPDGSVLWHGYIRDITERVETDAKLRKLTRAVEQSNITIVITDRDGRIEYANPHFEKVSGYSVEEALGQNPRMLQGGETPRETYAALWKTVLAGNEWRGELKNKRKNGTTYWENVIISPVRDTSGIIANFVAVKEDITEHKRMVEERTKLQAQLNQAQKMESVGRLAGGVAHDFNNLLTVINGTVELALASAEPTETYQADLVTIQQAAQRATALTRQLLTFSRQGVVQARNVSINSVVTSMLSMLQRIVGEDVTIDTELGEDAGIVRVDVGQLEQVLTNLTVNARDAMPRGGRITVSTARIETKDATGSLAITGDSVRLTVRDTGTGMTDEVQDRLFEPFFTTKPVGKGTGLGLAIVYGIVTQSGGTVTVDSTVGVGTAFHVQLPSRDEADSAPSADGRSGIVRGSGVILVVDDEPALGSITQRILQHAGYTVLLAHSGDEAIRMASSLEGKLDLLISDVIMPEMYGPEVATALRARDPALRVLFVSGHSGDILLNSGLAEHEYAFLPKPFSIPVLTRKVQEVLAG